MATDHQGLNILVLDGGSVPQGLSEILITKDLMCAVEDEENLDEEPLPSQYFDAISGAGVGGVIAILFGRFGLSVSAAMEEYLLLAEKVFAFPMANGTYDEVKLREAVQDLCEKYLGNMNALLLEETDTKKSKTCVFCTNAINATKPRIFRTYQARQAEANVTIWEAIHATLASPAMFPPISIHTGNVAELFIGSSYEHQNPTLLSLKEAQKMFGKTRSVGTVVSVGAGVGSIFSLQTERTTMSDSIETFLNRLSQSSHLVHQEALQRFEDADIYYRFNVNGIQDLDLSSWTPNVQSIVLSSTTSYLADVSLTKQVMACAKSMCSRQAKTELMDLNKFSSATAVPKPMPSVARQFIQRPSLKRYAEGCLFPQYPQINQRMCVLHGPGGSGKTQIALDVIRSYEDRLWRVFYIDASSEDQIKADLETAIRSLGRKYKDHKWEDALQVLANEQRPWLLFFDNADDPQLPLKKYFPKCSHGRVLITTRNRQGQGWAIDSAIHVQEMTEEEALSLLYAKANMSAGSDAVALKIVRELGCFALAVAQAGGYIRQRRSMETYLDHLAVEVRRRELMMRNETQTDTDYPLSVYASWDLSFNLLSDREKRFLRLCSSLHPSSIPRSIFMKDLANGYLSYVATPLVPSPDDHRNLGLELLNIIGNSYTLDKIAEKLEQCSLMSSSEGIGGEVYFNLHFLIHKWCHDGMEDAEKGRYEALACRLLSSAIPDGDTVLVHKTLRDLLPHIDCIPPQRMLRDLGDTYGIDTVYHQCGRYKQCLPLWEHILLSLQAQFAVNHPTTMLAMTNFACAYASLGRYSEAMSLHEQVLKQERSVYGQDHPNTTTSMVNLAATYGHLGRYSDAMELEVQVLEQRRSAFGPDHPKTVSAMSNLATTYGDLGRYSDAMALEVQVLEQRRSSFGPDHPETSSAMANLAATYRDLGRYLDAMELEIKVLEQRRSSFGPDHPETSSAMASLSATYWKLGRYSEAMRLYELVLEQRKSALGPDHPKTVSVMAGLATTYVILGRYSDAMQLEVQVLEQRRLSFGPDHPKTLSAIANLAFTYRDLGRHLEAMELEGQVLQKRQTIFGPNHPGTVQAMGNLATTYNRLEQFSDAVSIEEKVLEQRLSAFGTDHPDTVTAMCNLADTLRQLGRFSEAIILQERVLEQRKSFFGPDHTSTIEAMANLAITYNKVDRFSEAMKLKEQMLSQRRSIFEPDHPETVRAIDTLALTYTERGQFSEAVELREQALDPRRLVFGSDHVRTLRSNLADTYCNLGRLSDALALEQHNIDNPL